MTAGTRSGAGRLVEPWFPSVEISLLVAADRRRKDPVYGVHRWFARRPPTLVRALLLASHLRAPETTAAEDPASADGTGARMEDAGDRLAATAQFWRAHGQAGRWLQDAVVYDPFMGGGTSLVESARMGAAVAGRDVDPIAVAVVDSELHGVADGFDAAAATLNEVLVAEVGDRFAGPDPEWTPLHWFWLMTPTCGGCGVVGLLYRDLVVATSTGRTGAVVRHHAMHVFCPVCLTVHGLGAGRKVLRCCERRLRIDDGTYRRGRYTCRECGLQATYEDLGAATVARVMVAVEETHPNAQRRIRTATALDRKLAAPTEATGSKLDRPGPPGVAEEVGEFDLELAATRRDRRPVSAGYTTSRTLFTARQWALFTTAFTHVRAAGHDVALERDLTLMLTGALASNNVLCGYARDWGRLAPLFSVRGFSIPALSVELNPFHPTAGRGTLRSARARMTDRIRSTVRRAHLRRTHDKTTGMNRTDGTTVESALLDLPVTPASVDVLCRSADDTAGQEDVVATVCVTDPPYFDYIAYSELSEFYRTWLRSPGLGGAPLLPTNERAIESFATGLGAALKSTLGRLAPDAPLVFTYHSANADAWSAIGDAFDVADLSVVALWPVLADPHMGHHAAEGNCEWDVIVVARRTNEVTISTMSSQRNSQNVVTEWIDRAGAVGLKVGSADRASFEHAWRMARARFAYVVPNAFSGHGTVNPRSSS